MKIYVIESLIFSFVGLTWITVQEKLITRVPLDMVCFYSTTVYTALSILACMSWPNSEFHNMNYKSLFHIYFAMFSIYLHLVENFSQSNTHKKNVFGTEIHEIFSINIAISLSIFFVQSLITSVHRYNSLFEHVEWLHLILLVLSTIYCDISLRMPLTVYGYILWFFLILYWIWMITSVIISSITDIPSFFLDIVTDSVIILWQLAIYAFIVSVWNIWLLWTNIIIALLSVIRIIQHYTKFTSKKQKSNFFKNTVLVKTGS